MPRQLRSCLLALGVFLAAWLGLELAGNVALVVLGVGDAYDALGRAWSVAAFVLACVAAALILNQASRTPAPPPPPATLPPRTCWHCGNQPRPTAAFCNRCGARL